MGFRAELILLVGGWVGGRGALDEGGGGGGALDCWDGLGLLAGEEAARDVAGGTCEGVGFTLALNATGPELNKPPPEIVMTVEVVKSGAAS